MPPPAPAAPRVLEASYLASAATVGQLPSPVGIEIAFAGRSNVGKSSLLNALMGRRGLARTNRTPGCTRQISLFELRLAGGAVLRLVDLPGYGFARRSKAERSGWAALIETYLAERPTLAAVAILIDARRGAEPEEQALIALLGEPPRVSRRPLAVLAVATKLDKLPASQRQLALERLRRALGRPVLGSSIHDPKLVATLWARLYSATGLLPEAATGGA